MNTLFQKYRRNGSRWLLRRLFSELLVPQTDFGKKINPILCFIGNVLTFPLKVIRQISIGYKPNSETLFLIYDYEISPVTFDICLIICLADQERRKLNLKYMQVIFVPGGYYGLRLESQDYEEIVNINMRHWQQYNLVMPVTRLLPACTGVHHCGSRRIASKLLANEPNIFPKKYNTMLPIPHKIPDINAMNSSLQSLEATPQALNLVQEWLTLKGNERKPVVITLRQYEFMPCRNSNIEEWSKFATTLDQTKFFVVIVPDTNNAINIPVSSFEKYEHFTPASWNVELRSALYQLAYINLGINNGPFALCWFNRHCKYLMFKIITEDAPQTNTKSFKKNGFTIGEPPKFLTKFQKWIWQEDSALIIQHEFEKMCLEIEQQTS